jgi:hypothetical protein
MSCGLFLAKSSYGKGREEKSAKGAKRGGTALWRHPEGPRFGQRAEGSPEKDNLGEISGPARKTALLGMTQLKWIKVRVSCFHHLIC